MPLIRFILMMTLIIITLGTTQAQKKNAPHPDDIQKAKKLKSTYEDDKLAALESVTRYGFEYNAKTDEVVVLKTEAEQLISLESNVYYTPYVFYDEMSSVDEVNVLNHRGKNVEIIAKDEYYNITDFFYSDARVYYYRLKFPVLGSNYTISHEKKNK